MIAMNAYLVVRLFFFFFFQAEDGIRDLTVTGVQTCALPISRAREVPRPGLAYSMRPCRPRTSTGGPSTRTERSVHTSPLTLPTSNDASAPISAVNRCVASGDAWTRRQLTRSEEHTSELQSQSNLVCRLLLEKKK